MLQKSATAQFGSQKTVTGCQRTPAVRIQCSSAGSRPAQPTQPTQTASQARPSQDRRSFLLQLATTATLLQAGPALAENGFVQWWKSRRSANGGAKLLNPLYVAQARLQEVGLCHLHAAALETAHSMLTTAYTGNIDTDCYPECCHCCPHMAEASDAPSVAQQPHGSLKRPSCHGTQASALLSQTPEPAAQELTAALQLVRSSSLNCYMFEALPDDTFETRASLLTQQYELSVRSSRFGGGQLIAHYSVLRLRHISALSAAVSQQHPINAHLAQHQPSTFALSWPSWQVQAEQHRQRGQRAATLAMFSAAARSWQLTVLCPL
jgi:hypothetical protein